MGWGGLAAIDVDVNHGGSLEYVESLPRTVTTVSRNGYHPYFLVEPGRPINNHELFPSLPGATRTQAPAYLWVRDHQMVAPPTVVSLGNNDEELSPFEYKFLTDAGGERSFDECPIAPLPGYFYLDAITNGGKVGVSRNEYPDGTRHQMLVDTAVAMRKKGKSIDEIREALYLRNERDCKPPKPKGEIDREIKGIIEGWLVTEVAIATVSESSVGGQVDSGPQNDSIFERPFPDEFVKRDGGTKRLGTDRNVKELLTRLGVVLRYNVIKKEEELLVPRHAYSIDNRANATLSYVKSWCVRAGIATENLTTYLTAIADSNPYNPVANWIESRPWDGVSRLQAFYDTVQSPEKKLKELLMRKWLISAVAAAFEPNGVSAHGVLVFQGVQNLGKTYWFNRLVPAELEVTANGMVLRPDNKDSVAQIIGNWIVELGELDATISKSDVAQFKAFTTKNMDIIRRPYAVKESYYARRTVFFASVNEMQFLTDPSGNRRLWVVECEGVDYEHNVDMQQLWAEVATIYRANETWYLNASQIKLLNNNNLKFTTIDPIEELIRRRYNWDQEHRVRRTASEVLEELNIGHIGFKEMRSAGRALRLLSGKNPRRSHGRDLYDVPPDPFSFSKPV